MSQADMGPPGEVKPSSKADAEERVLEAIRASGQAMTIGALTAETLLPPAVVIRVLGNLLYRQQVVPTEEPEHGGLEVKAAKG